MNRIGIQRNVAVSHQVEADFLRGMVNRPESADRAWRPEYFSMIELMVVISIIVILITILLPALKTARQTSQKIACQSNLTQFHKAVSMYTLDWDDWVPGGTGSSYWYNPGCPGYFLNYLGGNGVGATGGCGAQVYGIMTCPANPIKFTWASNWSYGKNCQQIGKITKTMVSKNSYRIGILADANGHRITHNYEVEPRHLGGTNLVFLDGHTAFRKGYGVVDEDVAWYYDFTTGAPESGALSRGFFSTFNL